MFDGRLVPCRSTGPKAGNPTQGRLLLLRESLRERWTRPFLTILSRHFGPNRRFRTRKHGISLNARTRKSNSAVTTKSKNLRTLIPTLLLTGMRSGETMSLQWVQVDLMARAITVGRAKTSSGSGRVIPINDDLAHVLATHRQWLTDRFGEPRPAHYVFPWGSPEPSDPTRHITDLKRGWTELRRHAGVSCRLHDLRHTYATKLT